MSTISAPTVLQRLREAAAPRRVVLVNHLPADTTLLHLPEPLPHHPPEILGVYCVAVTEGVLLLPYAEANGAQGGPLFDLALAQTLPEPPQWFRDIVLYHDALVQWQRHVAAAARPAAS